MGGKGSGIRGHRTPKVRKIGIAERAYLLFSKKGGRRKYSNRKMSIAERAYLKFSKIP